MITIVLGMHRSGTSVVAGILHFNKIIMGTYETFWPRPLYLKIQKDFTKIMILGKLMMLFFLDSGYNVKDYKTIIPIPKVSKRAKMIKTIKKYESNFENWGWKDPRTCITMSNWMLILEEMD